MGPISTLFAAGLMAAQTAGGSANPPCNCQKNAAAQGPVQAVAETPANTSLFRGLFRSRTEAAPAPAEERPILSRLQSLFSGKKEAEPAIESATSEPPVAQPSKAPAGRVMQRMPMGQPSLGQPAKSEPLTIPASAPAAPIKVQPVTFQGVPANQAAPQIPEAVPATNPSPAAPTPAARPNRISPDLVGKVGHESDYSWITGQLRIENGAYVIHYATPETVDTYNGSLVLMSDIDLRGFQDGDFVSVRGRVSGGQGRAMYRVSGIDRLPR